MFKRAFRALKLPLGSYQTVKFIGTDLGDQFTLSGDEPRTLVMELTTAMDEEFRNRTVTALLTEKAQRHLIAVFEANLADDARRARELIDIFHSEYGEFKPYA